MRPNYGLGALFSLTVMVGVFGGLGYLMFKDGVSLNKTFGGNTLHPGDIVGVGNARVRVLTVFGDACTGEVIESATLFPGHRINFNAQEAIT